MSDEVLQREAQFVSDLMDLFITHKAPVPAVYVQMSSGALVPIERAKVVPDGGNAA